MDHSTQTELAARLKNVLKEHQRDGLSMIGGVDKLVTSLVTAVQAWIDEGSSSGRKSA
jgi:hypothetical protein